jgi:hypothetical protein
MYWIQSKKSQMQKLNYTFQNLSFRILIEIQMFIPVANKSHKDEKKRQQTVLYLKRAVCWYW